MASPVIVAGAGVVRDGVVDELRELVARTRLGVLNTFAAKGLFAWDAPAHLGTIGLQERDLELAGVAEADEVVLIGVDPAELDRGRLDALGVRWREVATGDVRSLFLAGREDPPDRPALYERLAAVCGPLYRDTTVPMNPARAAADLAGWLPPGGMVAADAGVAGFWLGRAFPTRQLGSIVLPTVVSPGFAAAQVLVASRLGRVGVVVVDEVDAATQAVLDRARAAGVPMIVERWSVDGEPLDPVARLAGLEEARRAGGEHRLDLAIDTSHLAELEEVAGPVCAWR